MPVEYNFVDWADASFTKTSYKEFYRRNEDSDAESEYINECFDQLKDEQHSAAKYAYPSKASARH